MGQTLAEAQSLSSKPMLVQSVEASVISNSHVASGSGFLSQSVLSGARRITNAFHPICVAAITFPVDSFVI